MGTDGILTERNAFQKGLNEIYADLERGYYGFPPSVCSRFMEALEQVIPLAGEFSFSGRRTKIEALLLEMTVSLRSVFNRGDEQAGEAVLKAVMESMDYLRRTELTLAKLDEEERTTRQHRVIDRMNLLVTLQCALLTVKGQVRELQGSQDELEEKQRQAAAMVENLKDSHPALRNEILYFRDHGVITGSTFLSYVRHMNDFTRAANLCRRNAIVLERQHEVLGRIETMLYSLNMMIFGTPELLGNVELAKLQMMAEDFRKDLSDAGEEGERIEGIVGSVEDTIDALGTEAARKNQKRIKEGQELLARYRSML